MLAGVSSLMFVAFTVYGVIKFYAVRFAYRVAFHDPQTAKHDRTYKKTKDARRDALTKVFTRWRVQRELEKDRRDPKKHSAEEELMEILEKLVTAKNTPTYGEVGPDPATIEDVRKMCRKRFTKKKATREGEVDEVDEKAAADFFELLEKLADTSIEMAETHHLSDKTRPLHPRLPYSRFLRLAKNIRASKIGRGRLEEGHFAYRLEQATKTKGTIPFLDSAGIDVTAKLEEEKRLKKEAEAKELKHRIVVKKRRELSRKASASPQKATTANDDGAGAIAAIAGTRVPTAELARGLTAASLVRGWSAEQAPEEARRQLDREEEDSTHVPSDDDEALPRVDADALGSVYRE